MKRVLAVFLVAAGLGLAQPVPSYKDLKYPPLPPVKIPEPTMVTLSNGMRVFLLEDHELPVINGLALVRTGNLFDPWAHLGPKRRTLLQKSRAGVVREHLSV